LALAVVEMIFATQEEKKRIDQSIKEPPPLLYDPNQYQNWEAKIAGYPF